MQEGGVVNQCLKYMFFSPLSGDTCRNAADFGLQTCIAVACVSSFPALRHLGRGGGSSGSSHQSTLTVVETVIIKG